MSSFLAATHNEVKEVDYGNYNQLQPNNQVPETNSARACYFLPNLAKASETLSTVKTFGKT